MSALEEKWFPRDSDSAAGKQSPARRRRFPLWAIPAIVMSLGAASLLIVLGISWVSKPVPVPVPSPSITQPFSAAPPSAPASPPARVPQPASAPVRFSLGITVSPPGAGTVYPGSGTYESGVSLTLAATPAPGYRFVSWSGDVSGTASSVRVTMDSNKNITANFARVTYTFSVTVSPPGAGTVYPGSGTYESGVSLTLAATPAPGYRFVSWSGDVSGTASSISVTMDSNKNITANFARVTYTLSVSASPYGAGTVSPPGGTYEYGQQLTLTAIPAPGYRFSHWSGDASGTSQTVTLLMNSGKTVIANFVVIRVSLITSVSPSGSGTVSPGSGTYDMGTRITLTALPASGYRFVSWSGDATGTSSAISITMDSDKSIVANFVSQQLVVTFGGWYVRGVRVDTAKKQDSVVAKVTISGGSPGLYTIRVRLDISWAPDETVSELTFNHQGTLSTKDLPFVASFARGEASTDGYHIDVLREGSRIWSMSDAYPPRLRVYR